MERVLPDGAPWLGGMSKRRISGRGYADLNAFLIETRRAEAAHWCMLLCTPFFYLWNPWWACIVMTLYGIAANIPCIVVQRVNRIKIANILRSSDYRTRSAANPCQHLHKMNNTRNLASVMRDIGDSNL